MSIRAFMFHGTHCGYLGKDPIPSYAAVGDGHVHYYDIDEEDSVGALYPDGARMIHPLANTAKFRKHIVKALEANREQRKRAPRPRVQPKKCRPQILAPTSTRPKVKVVRPKLKVRRAS